MLTAKLLNSRHVTPLIRPHDVEQIDAFIAGENASQLRPLAVAGGGGLVVPPLEQIICRPYRRFVLNRS